MQREEVRKFLDEFKTKLSIYGIVFRDDRNKNLQALADMEITPSQRTEYLRKLKVEHYCSGPHKNRLYPDQPDYWEFGMKIKNKDVYIKISMGLPDNKVVCISFHVTEHKFIHPFN